MNQSEIMQVLEALIEKEHADGCKDCAFIQKEDWEMPCAKCKRNCKDYWRIKDSRTDEVKERIKIEPFQIMRNLGYSEDEIQEELDEKEETSEEEYATDDD